VGELYALGVSDWLVRVLWDAVLQTTLQLVGFIGPFVLFGLLLHWFERVMQLPLARRFGWGSVLWTGWLGAPIHELSHVVMCFIFSHRIDELALFKPDRQTGRLGYVKHAYNPKNYFQVVGNLFIGLAPLLGGATVLYLMFRLFYPQAANQAFEVAGMTQAIADADIPRALSLMTQGSRNVIRHIVTADNLFTWQLWLFLYLTLCIGSHMPPSSSDYRGATSGGILLLAVIFCGNVVFLAVGGQPIRLIALVAPILGPALALFMLCTALCGLAAVIVLLFTQLWDLVIASR